MTTASHTTDHRGTPHTATNPRGIERPPPAPDDPIILTRAEYEEQATLHWRLGREAGFIAGLRHADRAFNTAIAEAAAPLPAPAHDIVAGLAQRMTRQAAA